MKSFSKILEEETIKESSTSLESLIEQCKTDTQKSELESLVNTINSISNNYELYQNYALKPNVLSVGFRFKGLSLRSMKTLRSKFQQVLNDFDNTHYKYIEFEDLIDDSDEDQSDYYAQIEYDEKWLEINVLISE